MGILSAKPLASLSSGLLARKGQARPAMRPQGFASLTGSPVPQDAAADPQLEDLGWNDMGGAGEPVPPVLVEREALAREVAVPETIAPEPVPEPVSVSEPAPEPDIIPAGPGISLATARRIGRESAGQTRKGKAAFTLRLEGERHLRLRLASAVAHRSAQALLVDALDRFLTTMPEVDALIAQLPKTEISR